MSNRSEIYLNIELFDSYLCEYAVCMAQHISGVCVVGHFHFDRTNIHFRAQRPEVRLLETEHAFQLHHLFIKEANVVLFKIHNE